MCNLKEVPCSDETKASYFSQEVTETRLELGEE